MRRDNVREFNSVVLFTVLYSQFKHCAKDVSKVTAQRTILEWAIKSPFKHFTSDMSLFISKVSIKFVL